MAEVAVVRLSKGDLRLFTLISEFLDNATPVFATDTYVGLHRMKLIVDKMKEAQNIPEMQRILREFSKYLSTNEKAIIAKDKVLLSSDVIAYSLKTQIEPRRFFFDEKLNVDQVLWQYLTAMLAIVNPSEAVLKVFKEDCKKNEESVSGPKNVDDTLESIMKQLAPAVENMDENRNPQDVLRELQANGVFANILDIMDKANENGVDPMSILSTFTKNSGMESSPELEQMMGSLKMTEEPPK